MSSESKAIALLRKLADMYSVYERHTDLADFTFQKYHELAREAAAILKEQDYSIERIAFLCLDILRRDHPLPARWISWNTKLSDILGYEIAIPKDGLDDKILEAAMQELSSKIPANFVHIFNPSELPSSRHDGQQRWYRVTDDTSSIALTVYEYADRFVVSVFGSLEQPRIDQGCIVPGQRIPVTAQGKVVIESKPGQKISVTNVSPRGVDYFER